MVNKVVDKWLINLKTVIRIVIIHGWWTGWLIGSQSKQYTSVSWLQLSNNVVDLAPANMDRETNHHGDVMGIGWYTLPKHFLDMT